MKVEIIASIIGIENQFSDFTVISFSRTVKMALEKLYFAALIYLRRFNKRIR